MREMERERIGPQFLYSSYYSLKSFFSQIKSLQEQYNKLQHRLDKIYIDKLDEIVTTEFYQEKTNEWKDEQSKILANIERHKDANTNYFEQGIRILELTQKAYSAYLEQNNTGKRNLLNILLSNCTLNDGNLYPTYRKPFDLLAKGLSRSNWLPLTFSSWNQIIQDMRNIYKLKKLISIPASFTNYV